MSLDTRNQIWDAIGPVRFTPDHQLHLPGHDHHVTQQIVDRLTSTDFDAWSGAASRVGFCSNPVPPGRLLDDGRQGHRGGAVHLFVGR